MTTLLLHLACSSDGGLKTYNAAPTATILTPTPSEDFREGESIAFQAKVGDNATAPSDLTVVWSANSLGTLSGVSSVDGDIVSLLLTDGMQPGDWTVTLQVTDEHGESDEDAVAFSVVANVLPNISLVSPPPGSRYDLGEPIPVSAFVTDADAASHEELTLTWGDAAAGSTIAPAYPDADGYASFELSALPPGSHSVSVTVTDLSGESERADVMFDVVDGDLDTDGTSDADDCDDENAAVHPAATEVCNDTDDDCDGSTDVGAVDAPTWYLDGDGDTWGDTDVALVDCAQPFGYVPLGGDCEDGDAAYNPGASEWCDDPADYNCDGSVTYADADGDGFAACIDCGDADEFINPDALEICNDLDDDCDGAVDNAATDAAIWYADADGDGFGGTTAAIACDAPSGYVDVNGDCDDGVASAYPGAVEICDAIDNDCDGSTDEDDALDAVTWYADTDADTYGDASDTYAACDAPVGYVADDTDCEDTDDTIHPGGSEVCENGVDEDCSGADDACALTGSIGLGAADAKFIGEDAGDYFSYSVGGDLDLDGDGYADVIACGYHANQIYVFPGPVSGVVDASTAALILTGASTAAGSAGDIDGDGDDEIAAIAASGDWYLVADPGLGSFAVTGAQASADFGGDYGAISSPGDFDDDGLDDPILVSQYGGVWVFDESVSGVTTSADARAVVAVGGQVIDASAIGDRTGDGIDDLGIGDVNTNAVRFFSGPLSGNYAAADADLTLTGSGDYGRSIAPLGDVDSDGTADVLFGAPQSTGALVLMGGDTATSAAMSIGGVPYIGLWVEGPGDVDDDGTPDALIGSNGSGAWLVSGPFIGSIDLATQALAFTSESTGLRAGWCVGAVGDTDGDAVPDLLIGDFWEPTGGSQAGAAYLFRAAGL